MSYDKIIMPERELNKSWQRTDSYKLSLTQSPEN